MAAKIKETDKVEFSAKDNVVKVGGMTLVPGILPETRPGIASWGNLALTNGLTDAQSVQACEILFAGIIASKGLKYVKDALSGASDAAKAVRANARASSNRALLDEYNASNIDALTDIAQELAAARALLAKAEDRLTDARKDAKDKLDVEWELDIQLLVSDEGKAYFYVPSDVLGKPAKSKGKSKSGTVRRARTYDFSQGKWGKTFNAKKFSYVDANGDKQVLELDGTITYDVTGKGPFTVVMSWDNSKGKGQAKATDDNMSTAGAMCAVSYYKAFGLTVEAKDIPTNLPAKLDVSWAYTDDSKPAS